ncbi:MAG: 1-deoxy-D-xylulose-5-phosphate reductoisomerase [Pseudomonadota bacterium]
MNRPRKVSVMGATGSTGRSTLSVVEHANRDAATPAFEIEALAAGRNVDLLIEQARAFKPKIAVIADESRLDDLREGLDGTGIDVAAGEAAVTEAAARPCDRVLAGIVGIAGLPSTLAAVEAGNDVALANKESLVCAGALLKDVAMSTGARLVPTDSEHNAMFQVMERKEDVEKLVLTASGGPFLRASLDEMRTTDAATAAKHPRWSMGLKISIDSASMMNKALEFIEASYLFDMPSERIDVLVHPQSVIHSMVSYNDGSVLAQLGSPDMRTPIAHALTWPDGRIETPVERLDLARIGQLDFEDVDDERFPAIRLAREALAVGGAAPAVLNCANEEAVSAFIAGACGFLDIAYVVEKTLNELSKETFGAENGVYDMSTIRAVDEAGRRTARGLLGALSSTV